MTNTKQTPHGNHLLGARSDTHDADLEAEKNFKKTQSKSRAILGPDWVSGFDSEQYGVECPMQEVDFTEENLFAGLEDINDAQVQQLADFGLQLKAFHAKKVRLRMKKKRTKDKLAFETECPLVSGSGAAVCAWTKRMSILVNLDVPAQLVHAKRWFLQSVAQLDVRGTQLGTASHASCGSQLTGRGKPVLTLRLSTVAQCTSCAGIGSSGESPALVEWGRSETRYGKMGVSLGPTPTKRAVLHKERLRAQRRIGSRKGGRQERAAPEGDGNARQWWHVRVIVPTHPGRLLPFIAVNPVNPHLTLDRPLSRPQWHGRTWDLRRAGHGYSWWDGLEHKHVGLDGKGIRTTHQKSGWGKSLKLGVREWIQSDVQVRVRGWETDADTEENESSHHLPSFHRERKSPFIDGTKADICSLQNEKTVSIRAGQTSGWKETKAGGP
ncbi:hypothetical protein DFH07DRAFT_772247 [Mycena maculata]|uniref:Uncharacterized protein n=1 Tax=Mycena maculata TaxID=230809 RepID=A0AAD7J8Z9_9AGAR|nr:hypothetical protein DFH07DRAFT_772247 [Mycena maculata]